MSQYIGGRIIPTHGGVWKQTATYEELTIVLYEDTGDSYISIIPVPTGKSISNTTYWMLFSRYSEDIAEALASLTETATNLTAELKEYTEEYTEALRTELSETEDDHSTIYTRMDSIETRLEAILEAATDENYDASAEVADIRIGYDETTYSSAGVAVRGQISDLHDVVDPLQTELDENNLEYLRAYVDEDGNILWGIKEDGDIVYGYGVPSQIQSAIDALSETLADTSDELEAHKEEMATEVIENIEFLRVYLDADGRVLWGIQADGDIVYGYGIPSAIKAALTSINNSISKLEESVSETSDTLNETIDESITELETTLTELISSLATEVTDNPEYIRVYLDSEGQIVWGIKEDGDIVYGCGIPSQIQAAIDELVDDISELATKTVDNEEWLRIYTDSEGEILWGIKEDGTIHEGDVTAKSISASSLYSASYDWTDDNLTELEEALLAHGFNPDDIIDWSDATELNIPTPRCAIVNVSNIASMPTSKTADAQGIIEFWDMQGNYFKKNAIMNAQGNSSLAFVKKNFSCDLCNDEWEGDDTFSLKIGEWVAQDSFHVKAFYTDFFRGIGIVSYQLYDEIVRSRGIMYDRPWKKALIDMDSIGTNTTGFTDMSDLTLQLDTGARCFPDAFPCIVYLNDEFYGIFAWQLKKHRDNFHQDKSTAEHIHLDGTMNTTTLFAGEIDWTSFEIRNPKNLYCMDGTEYDGDDPQELIDETSEYYDLDSDSSKVKTRKEMSAQVKAYIQAFSNVCVDLYNLYVAYASDKTDENLAAVKEYYETYFDVENQQDYLIAGDIIKNSDGFSKNWQWVTYDGVKWYVNMYDMDMSFGGYYTGDRTTAPLTTHVTTSRHLPPYGCWYYYEDEIEARYKELRDAGIIDADHIIGMLNSWTKAIGVDNYDKEYEKWDDSPCNNDNVINETYWELQYDEDGNPATSDSITYDSDTTYAVGDEVSYGIVAAMGYYNFVCLSECTGEAPITEFNHRDNIYRVKKWIDAEISNMDSLYNYS